MALDTVLNCKRIGLSPFRTFFQMQEQSSSQLFLMLGQLMQTPYHSKCASGWIQIIQDRLSKRPTRIPRFSNPQRHHQALLCCDNLPLRIFLPDRQRWLLWVSHNKI